MTVRRAEDQVACGDSGNDILMFEGAERGVVVGNAQVPHAPGRAFPPLTAAARVPQPQLLEGVAQHNPARWLFCSCVVPTQPCSLVVLFLRRANTTLLVGCFVPASKTVSPARR